MISRSTQSTPSRVPNDAPEESAPTAIVGRPWPHAPCPAHRRARRGIGPRLLVVAAATVALSGCALSGHSGRATPPVLGQVGGTPLVVGNPAPDGHGPARCRVVPRYQTLLGRRSGRTGCLGRSRRCGRDHRHRRRRHDVEGRSTSPGGARLSSAASRAPRPSQCMAVGSNGSSLPGGGVVVTTSDAGRTWAPVAAPQRARPGRRGLQGVAACTAIVNGGTIDLVAQSTDFGASWHQEGDLPAIIPSRERPDLRPLGDLPGGRLRPHHQRARTGCRGRQQRRRRRPGRWLRCPRTPASCAAPRAPRPPTCLAAGSTSTTVSDVVPAKGELLRSERRRPHVVSRGPGGPVEDAYGSPAPRPAVRHGRRRTGWATRPPRRVRWPRAATVARCSGCRRRRTSRPRSPGSRARTRPRASPWAGARLPASPSSRRPTPPRHPPRTRCPRRRRHPLSGTDVDHAPRRLRPPRRLDHRTALDHRAASTTSSTSVTPSGTG